MKLSATIKLFIIKEGYKHLVRIVLPELEGKRFNQATIVRKAVLKGQRKFERVQPQKLVQRSALKPVQKTEENTGRVQPRPKKPIVRHPSMEPPSNGHYELNPLMTRMVDKELQDIMIKVWQELPDNPSQKADKVVVDKFRNEAGDELRNVLGLNVTKRLLNVHNPLYVKVYFTKRPERDHLKAFLIKYRCIKFERVDEAAKTFTALMKNIQDFDKICSVKSIRIGNIKVYISPNYEFSKCPPNLKTNYNEKSVEENEETNLADRIKANNANTIKNEDKNANSPPKVNENVKLEKETEVKSDTKISLEVKEKVVEPKKPAESNIIQKDTKAPLTVNKPVTQTKPASADPVKVSDGVKPNKPVTMKSDETKPNSETAKPKMQQTVTQESKLTKPINKTPTKIEAKTPNKTEGISNITNKTETPTKVETTKVETPVNSGSNVATPVNSVNRVATPVNSVNKVATPGNSVNKVATAGNSVNKVATPGSSVNKVANPVNSVSKVATPGSSVNKVATPVNSVNKAAAKPITQQEPPKKIIKKEENSPKKQVTSIESNASKINTKVVPKPQRDKGIKNKVRNKTETLRILEEGNDYDVLGDDEILALINGGVILDECSGSDAD